MAPPARVYFADDTPPTCPVEKIGMLALSVSSTATGDALGEDLRKEVGRKARARGADAVIDAKWEKMLTIVVARSPSDARAKSEAPPRQDVTGTLVRFVDPACTM